MILTVTMNVAVDKRYVVDEFEVGGTVRVRECTLTAGGKGINVARVATLLGEKVIATGILGGGAGEYILKSLKKTPIKSDFVKCKGESRTNINIFENKNKTQTQFVESGAEIEDTEIKKFLRKYSNLLKKADTVVISGSLPLGVKSDFYKDLIKIAKKKGRRVLFDSSGEAFKNALAEKPDFIKPNIDELEDLLGKKLCSMEDIANSAKELFLEGMKYVVVSLGKDGAVLVCKDGVFRGYTPEIHAVNTLGCGDSMVSAFAVGLSKGEQIKEIFKNSLAVSVANALNIETGFYLDKDLKEILPQIIIEEL